MPFIIKMTDIEFSELLIFVKKNFGLDLNSKKALIEGRLSGLLIKYGYKNFTQLLNYLKFNLNSIIVEEFLNKITTNYSFFGREFQHFDYLTKKVLPYFEANDKYNVRIWSAGCSGGQEAYTMAMCIDKYFSPKKKLFNFKIIASDISNEVLKKASKGIFSTAEINSLPATWQMEYFKNVGIDKHKVSDYILKSVEFKPQNLMNNFNQNSKFDVIFCRNVMIYFDRDTSLNLVNKFYNVTNPGGFFFTSHSEVLDKKLIKYKYNEPSIYQKI